MSTADAAVPTTAGLSFSDLVARADIDVVDSQDLVKDKRDLVGTPLVITRITFSPGDFKTGFVSLEATLDDDRRIVFNDGSTGVRRQILAYAVQKGYLIWPTTADGGTISPMTEEYSDYEIGDSLDVEIRFSNDGRKIVVISDIALFVRHGLRLSEYESEDGPATTYYLN